MHDSPLPFAGNVSVNSAAPCPLSLLTPAASDSSSPSRKNARCPLPMHLSFGVRSSRLQSRPSEILLKTPNSYRQGQAQLCRVHSRYQPRRGADPISQVLRLGRQLEFAQKLTKGVHIQLTGSLTERAVNNGDKILSCEHNSFAAFHGKFCEE